MSNYIGELFEKIVVSNRVKDCEENDDCNISDEVILALCGGIPDNSLANLKLNINITSSCVYEVEVVSDLYYLNRLIDFNKHTINNFLMRVALSSSGIGTHLFVNQIVAARKMGFDELVTSAAEGRGFNGYCHWGKQGYTMTALDRNKFSKWCTQNGLECLSLNEILDTADSAEKWKNYGFGWSGIFNTKSGSKNIEILEKYLSERSHFAALVDLLQ